MGMRLWCVVLAVAALIVVLAACGGDDHSGGGDQEPESGTLTVLAARVERRPGADAEWAQVIAAQPVAGGDAVRTDATGSALLTFYTGTEVEIRPGSEIEITQFTTDVDDVRTITLTQLGGETLHRVELVADAEDRYVVDTPVAHLVVRGTVFGVQVAADGATRVEVQEGTVRAEIADQVYDIPPGQALDVTAGRDTEGPLPLAPVGAPDPTPSIEAIRPPDER